VKFLKSRVREEQLGTVPPSEGATTPYLDQGVMVVILLNTICMTLDHFQGYPVDFDLPHQPAGLLYREHREHVLGYPCIENML
jgi:hypothetical protein